MKNDTSAHSRTFIMAVLFLTGLALVIWGWRMPGSLVGLGIMLVGLALLLAALYIYNKAFTDPKPKKARRK